MEKFFVVSTHSSENSRSAFSDLQRHPTKEAAVEAASAILQNTPFVKQFYIFEAIATVSFPPKPVLVKDL